MTLQTAKTVFFDESGFDGLRLLDPSSPTFVYASVAIEEAAAKDVIDTAFKNAGYGVRFKRPDELSWTQQHNTGAGLKVIREVLSTTRSLSKTVVIDKVFSVVKSFCMFLFTGIEGEDPELLLTLGYWDWLIDELAISYIKNEAGTRELVHAFWNFRTSDGFPQDHEKNLLLPELDSCCFISRLTVRLTKCLVKRAAERHTPKKDCANQAAGDITSEDLKVLGEPTVIAIQLLLSEWGKHGHPLNVICDDSKPMRLAQDYLELLRARGGIKYSRFSKLEDSPFLLTNRIRLEKSHQFFGLQIADVIAGATRYASGNSDALASDLKKLLAVPCRGWPNLTPSPLRRRFAWHTWMRNLGVFIELTPKLETELTYSTRGSSPN